MRRSPPPTPLPPSENKEASSAPIGLQEEVVQQPADEVIQEDEMTTPSWNEQLIASQLVLCHDVIIRDDPNKPKYGDHPQTQLLCWSTWFFLIPLRIIYLDNNKYIGNMK
ncbi:hypothetical protein CDL15_Pgr022929 [Punica granatum]|nr:hypothetical protein CDL15_Pgr022929 [Punica granatum]